MWRAIRPPIRLLFARLHKSIFLTTARPGEEQLLQSLTYAASNAAQHYLICSERTLLALTQPGIHPANPTATTPSFSAELELSHLVPNP